MRGKSYQDGGRIRGPGGEGIADLTVAQRVLLHLSLFSKHREEFDVPPDVTQQGVARALGLSRSHIALELKKLLEEGALETRLAHVRGARSRRKVYFNTYQGERVASGLRERVHSHEARWIDPKGSPGKGAGAQLIRLARQEGRPLSGVYLAVLGEEVVDLRPEEAVRTVPRPPRFVGRRKERASLQAWAADGPPLMLITGLPGIGKTALAQTFLADRPGVWVKVFPFDSAASLVASLATALARAGRPRLLSYLKGNPLDFAEVGLLLSREASDLLLVFDDVTASPEASRVLRLLLDQPAPGGQMLLTARETPTFLGTKDRLEGRVAELRLGGLTLEDSGDLLRALGRDDGAEQAYKLTLGHPLLLRIVATTTLPDALPDTEAFLLEEVMTDLEPEEQEALFRAAVFRRPVAPEALAGCGFPTFQALRRKGLLVENGGHYEVHDLVAPAIRRQGRESLQAAHREAARYWESQTEWIEAAHHLAKGGRTGRAVKLVRGHVEEILQSGQGGKLEELLERLPTDPSVYVAMAWTLDYLGRWTEASEIVEEGLAAGAGLEETPLLLLRGRIASKRGDLMGARAAFLAAEERGARFGLARERGLALYHLGIAWRKEGESARALSDLKRAMTIFETMGADWELGRARMETGVVHLQEGRYQEAIAWFGRADPLLAPWKADAAALTNNLAIAYREAGRREESLEAFDASVRLAEAAGSPRAQGYALVNAADLLARQGRLDQAAAHCAESLAIAEALGEPVMISACYANQGLVAREGEGLAEALALYEKSLKALEGTEVRVSRAARQVEMSDLLERMGDHDRARALRRRARDVLGKERVKELLRQLG